MRKSRAIKTPEEVLKIKKACKLGDITYSQILKKIRIGVSEKELAREITKFIRSNNARLSFRPIVAFGKNAYEIHHKSTDLKLRKNHDFVLFDLGAKVNGYCSDMSRTIFFGRVNSRQRKMYQTVLKAQEKAVEFIKSSIKNHKLISTRSVDKIARDYIIAKGYPSITHSLGHGIGRRVH